MNDDELFQFDNQYNASNYREEEEALRKREEEERRRQEQENTANAGVDQSALMPKVDTSAKIDVPKIESPVQGVVENNVMPMAVGSAAMPQSTGQAGGNASGTVAGTVAADPAAADGGDSFEFDVPYRGSRSAEIARGSGTWGDLMNMGRSAAVGSYNPYTNTEGSGLIPAKDDIASQMSSGVGAGVGTTAPAPETTGVGADWGDDPEQTWDSFQRWLEKKDAQFQKQERNKAWWELMTRGLVGAANLYGTTQGAPSLDLSGSKDAFNSKDSYARLQNEKQQMYNLVNRRIEQMQKEKNLRRQYVLAEGKVKESETKIKNMEKEIERKQKESDAKVDLLLKQGKTAEAQQEKVAQEAARKQMENSVWMEKYNLEKAKTEADIAARYAAADRSRAAAAKDRNGGNGSGGGKGKTVTLAGKQYTIPTGGDAEFRRKAYEAGVISNYKEPLQAVLEYVTDNPDSESTKKFLKSLGLK